MSRGVADPERVASGIMDTAPSDQGAMDTLLCLTSAHRLNAVLDTAGVLRDLQVRDVSIISDRPTLVSRIIRLRLTYDGPASTLPGSLIVKTAHPERALTVGSEEVAFYRDVAPSLPAGLVPRCFEAHRADATMPWHLVLEDLTDTHALATEWPLPPSEAQCRTIVGSLARFHAAWWDDPRLGVSVGAWPDDAAVDRFIQQMARYFDVFAGRLGDELSHERRAFYERLIAEIPRLQEERYRDTRNITLAHGDAHVWNCFLPRNGSDDVRWFDWDGWRIRAPTIDLAYMMALHWYPERRRRLEGALLDYYHQVLLENGVHSYSRADMREDYRLSVLLHTITPVFMAGLKLPPVIWWNNFQRIMAAVDDLGCRELLG